jgi:phenylalanyl-tRNA synthetase beta chain
VRTAATGRKLNVESDARYRFERGVDPAFARPGMEIATRMVLDMCGGEPSEPVVTGEEPEWRRQYTFRPTRVRTLGGVDGDELECEKILTALGFTCSEAGTDHVVVEPPSWRADIVGEADLVEEVLRIRGYDSIPPVSLTRDRESTGSAMPIGRHRGNRARRALAARGMMEAVTWSFMKREQAALFGGTPPSLALANPISSELDVMRPSLLPNLIAAAQRNADRGLADAALFEVGPQYSGDDENGQQAAVSGIRTGFAQTRNWQGPARQVDTFDAKADALAALGAAGAPVAKLQTSSNAPDWYHPGRSGSLQLGNNVLAHFGELHPAVLDAHGVKTAVVGFEIILNALPVPKAKAGRARATLVVSDFPPVERDFAFVLDADVPAETLVRAAKNADKALVASVTVFDMFEGERIGEGKKSVAFSVRLEPADRTLTDDEIEAVSANVVANVEKMAGGTLRR